MIRRLIFSALLAAMLFSATAQPPYQFGFAKESAFLGGGAAMLGLGLYFNTKTPLFTPDEVKTLDPMDINAFDRLATGMNSMKAHYASNIPLYGSYGLPVLFLGDKDTRRDFPQIITLFGETILLNAGVTFLMKSTFRRPRPYVFDPNIDLTRKQKRNAKASFVSGHASSTAANTIFMAKVYSDYFPDSKAKPYVWGTAIIIPAVTGYLRVRAGRHYPTDTIAGCIIGAAAGYFVTYLHRYTD